MAKTKHAWRPDGGWPRRLRFGGMQKLKYNIAHITELEVQYRLT